MPNLAPSALAVLEIIAKHDGEWNWYQIGRAAFDIMSDDPGFRLSSLVESGLVTEELAAGETISRFRLTSMGKQLIGPDGEGR